MLRILRILQDFINQGNYDLINTYKLYLKIDDEIKNNINIEDNIANIFLYFVYVVYFAYVIYLYSLYIDYIISK